MHHHREGTLSIAVSTILSIKYVIIFWILARSHGLQHVFELEHILLAGPGTQTQKIPARSLLECIHLCESDLQCISASFNTLSGTCYINQVALTGPHVVPEYNTDHIFTEFTDRNEDGFLIFRGTAGIGQPTLEAWNNQGHDDRMDLGSDSVGCLTINNLVPCDRHIRSWRLDHWVNISKVTFAFYTDSQRAFFVTFDAIGAANPEEAFKVARIIDSSVTQLIGWTGSCNVQTIIGPFCHRVFYLNSYYNGCSGDMTWMNVIDDLPTGTCCDYEKAGSHPRFLHTKTTERVNFGNADDAGVADVFAVFIAYI